MQNKQKVYFLCTGNSCRGQMAEGFAKKYLEDSYEIYSAGIEPRGINPLAIKVMQEKGIDITNQTSDLVSTKLLNQSDFVITLCKDAKERCPVVLPRSSHYHWPFDDPAQFRGTEVEILNEFRRVRDEIESNIQKFIQGDAGVAVDINVKKNEQLVKKKDFGDIIRLIRESKGVSVEELADLLQISEDYLLKTEKNMTEPSKFFIHRLANACQVNYDDVIDRLYYVKSEDISNLIN